MGFEAYLRGQDALARLENERAAEQLRQSAIAEGVGAGPARAELVQRDLQAREASRRAQTSRDLFGLIQAEQDRITGGITTADALASEEQRRMINALHAGEGILQPRSFAPSGFEQTVAATGGLLGESGGFGRRWEDYRTPPTFPGNPQAGRDSGSLIDKYSQGGMLGGRKYGVFGPKINRTRRGPERPSGYGPGGLSY